MLNFSSIDCDLSKPLDMKYSTNFLGLNSPGLGISTTPATSISTMPTITAFSGSQPPGTTSSGQSHNNRHLDEQQTSICSLEHIPSDMYQMQNHHHNINNNDFHSGHRNDQQHLPEEDDDNHHHHSHHLHYPHHHHNHLIDLLVESQEQQEQPQQIFSQQIDLELEENQQNEEDQLELEQQQEESLNQQDIDLDQPQGHQQQEQHQDQIQSQYPSVSSKQISQSQKPTESVFNEREFNLNSPHGHYTSISFQGTNSIVQSKKHIEHHQISQSDHNICSNNNTPHNNNIFLGDFCEQFGFESACDPNSQSKRESFASSSSSSRIANLTESESSSLPRRRVVHMQQLAKSGIFDCEDPTNQQIDLGIEGQEVKGIMNRRRLQQQQLQEQQQQLIIPFNNNNNKEGQYIFLTEHPSDCLIHDNSNNIQDIFHNNACLLPSEFHHSELLNQNPHFFNVQHRNHNHTNNNGNHSNENIDQNQSSYQIQYYSDNITNNHSNHMKVYRDDSNNNKIKSKNVLNSHIPRFEESKQQQQQQQQSQQIFTQPQRLGVRLTPYPEEQNSHGVSQSHHPTILGFSSANLSFMLPGDILIDLSQLAELLKQKDVQPSSISSQSSSAARSSIPEFNLNPSGKPTCNSSVNNISAVRFRNSALNFWKRCTRIEKDSSENGCYYISLDSRPEKAFSSVSAIRQCLAQLKRRRIALNQQLPSANIELFDAAAERIEIILETAIRKDASIGARQQQQLQQSQPSLATTTTTSKLPPGCVSQSSPVSQQIPQDSTINANYPQSFDPSHNPADQLFPRQLSHPSSSLINFRPTDTHTNSSKYPPKQSQHLHGSTNQSHSKSRKPSHGTPLCTWTQCQKQARMILKELVNASGSNKSFVFGQLRSGESSISQQIYSPKLVSILFGSKQPSSQFSSQLLRRGLVSLFDPHSAHAITLLSMNHSNSSSTQHTSSSNSQVKSGKISLTLFTADDFQIPITVTLRSYNLNQMIGRNHSSTGNNNSQVASQNQVMNAAQSNTKETTNHSTFHQHNNTDNSSNGNAYHHHRQQQQNIPYSLPRHSSDNNKYHKIPPQQQPYSGHYFNSNATHYSSQSSHHPHHPLDDTTAYNQYPNNFDPSCFLNISKPYNPSQQSNQIPEEIYLPSSEHINNNNNLLPQDHSDTHILDIFDIKIKIKYQKQLKTFRESLLPLPLRKQISKTSTNNANERANSSSNSNNNNNHTNHENDQSFLSSSGNTGNSYCEAKNTSLQTDNQKPMVIVLQGSTNGSNNAISTSTATAKKQELEEISKHSQSLSYYRDAIGFLTRFYPDKLSSTEKLQSTSLLKQI